MHQEAAKAEKIAAAAEKAAQKVGRKKGVTIILRCIF